MMYQHLKQYYVLLKGIYVHTRLKVFTTLIIPDSGQYSSLYKEAREQKVPTAPAEPRPVHTQAVNAQTLFSPFSLLLINLLRSLQDLNQISYPIQRLF